MKYIFYACLGFALLLGGCSKKLGVDSPDALTISLDPSRIVQDTFRYKVGDTTKFVMTGNAQNISFYSGELYHNYQLVSRTTMQGILNMSFTSLSANGTQTNTLQVLATDQLTKVDSAHIVNANWTDITSKFFLSPGYQAAAGTVNLTSLLNGPTDSLFIAFKYNAAAGSIQRNWNITALTLNNVLPDGSSFPIYTQATDFTTWTSFKIAPSTASWVTSATQLAIVGGTATAPANTAWIVSRPLYPSRVNPDLPVIVKQLGSEVPIYTVAGKTYQGYNYKYVTPGVYTATFVVTNTSPDDKKTVTKQFVIKVQ